MTTAATSLLGLALPVTGELSGTWGDTVNNSITSLLDSAIAGTTTLSTDADVTLTTTTLSANQAREAIILWTAAGTVTRTITAPAQSKTYVVINKSSTQSIKLVGVGPTTGVTLVAGEYAVVAWNGTDFVKTANASGAASFTDLTVSGSETLSGGTANGVAYLNGSKVVTTGSALTFDGTNLATSGNITLNNTQYFQGKTSGGSTVRLLGINSGDTAYVGAIDSGPTSTIFNASSTSTYAAFYASGSEQMRLTSTGLGIGTSSPATKLEVVGSVTITATGAANALYLRDSSNNYIFDLTGSAGNYVQLETRTAIPLTFGTNSTERMRLTTGGVLLLGATTTQASETMRVANSGVQNSILVSNSASTNGAFYVGYNDAAIIGVNRNPASGVLINASNYTADLVLVGSSTTSYISFETSSAANTTPTERMRLDSVGNLGIGTTANASAILDAQSTTKGVRMPNMTTTQKNAIASPAAGLIVFDTTLAKLCVYTGAAWQTITST